MGYEAIYNCKNCGNQFQSREGGGLFFDKYRYVSCDTIKNVKTMDKSTPPEKYKPPTKKQIGACPKCGGELKNDINPMCPECKSRDVEEKEILSYYD